VRLAGDEVEEGVAPGVDVRVDARLAPPLPTASRDAET